MNELNKQYRDLSSLIRESKLNREWLIHTRAKPTKVALWTIDGKLQVCAIYWEGNEGGAWEDENAVSVCSLILDLPDVNRIGIDTGDKYLNSVIGCAEKLYYDINPDTKMDVPSFFYEKVEAKRPGWFQYMEAGGKMNFYEYCKAELRV